MKNFILASQSPRRFSLLKNLALNFTVQVANINEEQKLNEEPLNYVLRLSFEKAYKVYEQTKSQEVILAADTIVYIDKTLFDKPKNLEEAKIILKNLSGRTHFVSTAYCLLKTGKILKENIVTTKVTFRNLKEEEIDTYLLTGDSLDKAGAYGIQSEGAFLIDEVYGSYTNIIGLPIKEVLKDLVKYNF